MTTSHSLVLIVSHEPLMRLGLRSLLHERAGIRRCHEAASSAEAMEIAAREPLHLALLVAGWGSEDAPRLIRDLRRVRADLPVLVIGRSVDADSVRRLFNAGALGYVTCVDELAELLLAVAAVSGRNLHVSAQATGFLLGGLTGRSLPASSSVTLDVLSDREMEVFRLVGNGKSVKEIAHSLHISVKTVETHKQRMRDKLHLHSGSELNRLAASRAESANGDRVGVNPDSAIGGGPCTTSIGFTRHREPRAVSF